jgi:hypothetical protein
MRFLRDNRFGLRVSIVLSIMVLLLILYFGLRPKDFVFSNNVRWIQGQAGVHFGKYGIAYTPAFGEWVEEGGGQGEFSIEIALKAFEESMDGFGFILSCHNGKDREQLLIAQWHSWLILMNGDDYAHKRKTKRLSVDMASMPQEQRFITITTGEEGTKLYLDGHIVKEKKDLTLKMPNETQPRLVLGNSVYGRHSWDGDVYGLAFYRYGLSSMDAAHHFSQWSDDQSFSFAAEERPFVLYLFDEKQATSVLDHTARHYHMRIPSRMQILKKDVLSHAWDEWMLSKYTILDIVINFLGFMPFGFVLSAMLHKLGRTCRKHYALTAFILCFMVSLIIEISQAWIPLRSSSIHDLILNILGGLAGIAAFRLFISRSVETS